MIRICILMLVIILFNCEQSNESKILLRASMKEDLFIYELTFYEDLTYRNEITGLFFFKEEFFGKFVIIDSNTIQFTKIPYDRDGFVPDQLFIDRERKALLFERGQVSLHDWAWFKIWEIDI